MNAALDHNFTVSSLSPSMGLTAGAILLAEETSADLPHLIRSHKYGDALMTQDQFQAKEEIPKLMRAIQDAAPCGSTAYQLNNRIRIRHSITHHDDVPADEAEECVIFLRELLAETKSRNFKRFGGNDGELEFVRHVIGGNEPSTAWISRKLGYKPTGRPNWRELAQQVNLQADHSAPTRRTLQERAVSPSVASAEAYAPAAVEAGDAAPLNHPAPFSDNDVWTAPYPSHWWADSQPNMPPILRKELAELETLARGLSEVARVLSNDEDRREGVDAFDGYEYKSDINRDDLRCAQSFLAEQLVYQFSRLCTSREWGGVRGDIKIP